MRFLVIGLGSMGKRRVRCLKALGENNIIGFDIRKDRCIEAEKLYSINTVSELGLIDFSKIDSMIISTPPDLHSDYLKISIERQLPTFVEASVLLDDLIEINRQSKDKNVFIAPSCTMRFHPLIKDIYSIVRSKKYGKITNFSYHSGQYLPDWHPWENISNFYVSNRLTGGGREIVPFELTWLVDLIGQPSHIKGFFEKTINLGVEIEDTYAFSLKINNILGSVVVDVACRFATRNLILNFESAQLLWNWNDCMVKLYEADSSRWIEYKQPAGNSAVGYNNNIVEEMYIDEIDAFIKGISDVTKYPNNLDDDIAVLNLLYDIEKSDGGF